MRRLCTYTYVRIVKKRGLVRWAYMRQPAGSCMRTNTCCLPHECNACHATVMGLLCWNTARGMWACMFSVLMSPDPVDDSRPCLYNACTTPAGPRLQLGDEWHHCREGDLVLHRPCALQHTADVLQ